MLYKVWNFKIIVYFTNSNGHLNFGNNTERRNFGTLIFYEDSGYYITRFYKNIEINQSSDDLDLLGLKSKNFLPKIPCSYNGLFFKKRLDWLSLILKEEISKEQFNLKQLWRSF